MTQTIPTSNNNSAANNLSSHHPQCTSTAPRVPLSSIVTVLVDEWSRSYTVGALQGDIESMCMLSSAHFAKSGFGCIPHDTQRGYDWLDRAKKAVVERAAQDAKRYGKKICRRDLGAKEAELENDIIIENCFTEPECQSITALKESDIHTDQSLDDHMSSGSLADSLASLSCGNDTNAAFIADVEALPSDASVVLPSSIESDGTLSFFSHDTRESSSSVTASSVSNPPSRRHSLRSSVSHPDLTATTEWRKWTEEGGKHHANRITPVLSVESLYEASESESDTETPPVNPDISAAVSESSLDETNGSTIESAGSSTVPSAVTSEVDSPISRVESPAPPLLLVRSTTN